MYATYEFYTGTYGGKLTEDVFNSLEARAEMYIRYLTLKEPFEVELNAVKMAVCKAVDVIAVNSTTDGETGAETAKKPVNSESIDGYSVTFGTSATDETADDALRKLILRGVYCYLLPTGLLYRGIGHAE